MTHDCFRYASLAKKSVKNVVLLLQKCGISARRLSLSRIVSITGSSRSRHCVSVRGLRTRVLSRVYRAEPALCCPRLAVPICPIPLVTRVGRLAKTVTGTTVGRSYVESQSDLSGEKPLLKRRRCHAPMTTAARRRARHGAEVERHNKLVAPPAIIAANDTRSTTGEAHNTFFPMSFATHP